MIIHAACQYERHFSFNRCASQCTSILHDLFTRQVADEFDGTLLVIYPCITAFLIANLFFIGSLYRVDTRLKRDGIKALRGHRRRKVHYLSVCKGKEQLA
jgi:hypothetical protein